jgi:hypothetical protein
MRLASDSLFREPNEDPLLFCHTETGWQEVSRGLRQVLSGYVLFLAGVILGSYFIWVATSDPLAMLRVARGKEVPQTLVLGAVALALGVLGGCGLVLTGLWCCLGHAPQRQNAKELMLLSFNCVLLGALLGAAGVCVAGPDTYDQFRGGAALSEAFDLFDLGGLLVLGSAGLGLLGTLFFVQFLRNVAGCFDDRRLLRQVDGSVGLLGLLVGATAGLLFCARGLSWLPSLWLGVGAGWAACFVWQAWLCARTSRCIEDSLRASSQAREAPPPGVATGSVGLRTLSGLRRLIKLSP